jgi:hypothetical protein
MVDRLLTCVPELRPCLERRWRKTAQCSGVPDREKCIVFSSITAADIPADHELRGTRMLRALLDFAETGKLAPGSPIGGFDSPFEGCYPGAIRFGATASKSVRRSPETGLPSFVMCAGWILRVSSRLHYVSGRTRAWLKMQVCLADDPGPAASICN